MKKILLYSGGMDSYLIDKIWQPDVKLYIDLNSKYAGSEIDKLKSRNADVVIDSLDLSRWERKDSIIPLRNLYLVMWATNYADEEGAEICLGATAGDRVLDKSIGFKERAEELLNYLYEEQHWTNKKNFIVNLDFKGMTKTDLLQKYISMGGDINEAWNASLSCYNPTRHGDNIVPCWCCKACFRKFISFAICGMKFENDILDKVIPYIKSEIVPQIEAGTYGRGKEEEEILKVIELYERGDLNA